MQCVWLFQPSCFDAATPSLFLVCLFVGNRGLQGRVKGLGLGFKGIRPC